MCLHSLSEASIQKRTSTAKFVRSPCTDPPGLRVLLQVEDRREDQSDLGGGADPLGPPVGDQEALGEAGPARPGHPGPHGGDRRPRALLGDGLRFFFSYFWLLVFFGKL